MPGSIISYFLNVRWCSEHASLHNSTSHTNKHILSNQVIFCPRGGFVFDNCDFVGVAQIKLEEKTKYCIKILVTFKKTSKEHVYIEDTLSFETTRSGTS